MGLHTGEVVGRRWRERQRAAKAQRRSAVPATEHVHRDPEHVSGRIVEQPDVVPSLEHANERFLSDLLGLVSVAGHEAERREQAPVLGPVELLEARRALQVHVDLLWRSHPRGSQIRVHPCLERVREL
jgi:hypothetical protein